MSFGGEGAACGDNRYRGDGLNNPLEGLGGTGVLGLDDVGTELHRNACCVDDEVCVAIWCGVAKLAIVVGAAVRLSTGVHNGEDRYAEVVSTSNSSTENLEHIGFVTTGYVNVDGDEVGAGGDRCSDVGAEDLLGVASVLGASG